MSEQQQGEPTEEELRAALEEQMRRIHVDDVLLQTVVTLVNLGGRRLGLAGEGDDRDLGQARTAIEATRALLPLLPQEQTAPIKEALTQLQMAYAREVQQGGGAQEGGRGQGTGGREQGSGGADEPSGSSSAEEQRAAEQEAERAKARSKIWTPPGT